MVLPSLRTWPLAGCLLAATGCGGLGETPSDEVLGGPGATGTGGAPPEVAPSIVPLTGLDACLGPSQPIKVVDGLPYASLTFGDAAPAPAGWFLLDTWTTNSRIYPAGFGSTPPTSVGCVPDPLGTRCTFAGVDFCGSKSTLAFIEGASVYGSGIVEAGILGTDYMSKVLITLDYGRLVVHRTVVSTWCTDAALEAGGLTALSTQGFYSKDPSKQFPMTRLQADAGPDLGVATAPVVPVRFFGVDALAAVDSGGSDIDDPLSPSINAALFDTIRASYPSALWRDAARDIVIVWADGVEDTLEAYAVSPSAPLDYMATDGTVAKSFPLSTVFLYGASADFDLARWSTPAMHVGASFFASFGTVALDPFSSRVWVGKL
jgi:hypothetical protein